MTTRSRSTRRPLSKAQSRTVRPLAKSSGTTRNGSQNKAKTAVKKPAGKKAQAKKTQTKKAPVQKNPAKKAKRALESARTAKKSATRSKAKPVRSIAPKARTKKSTRESLAPSRGQRREPERRRGRPAKAVAKPSRRGTTAIAPVIDPRQLALPFSGSSAKSGALTEKRRRGRPRKSEAVAAPLVITPPVSRIPPPRPAKKVELPPPPELHSPVAVSMTRLEAALEKENQKRSGGDRSPDSVARGLPIGVRRGRLMPRAEQSEESAASSRSANFDALERYLAGAGVIADADAMRGYLNPWLNGSDVLAFIPADRAALIGAGSVAVASQKKVLIVLPNEENVVDQLNMLRASGLDAKTLPHAPEERTLEAKSFSRAASLVLVLSLEQLLRDDVVDDVRTICVDLLAIDECQRVSELAPDFDPSVERMADLAPRIGRPPTLALLRAVPPSVRSDLPHRLGLRNPLRVDLSPVHDGLSLDVISTDPNRRLGLLAEQLRMSHLPAVVLGYSMADVNEIHNALCQAGFDAHRLDSPANRPQNLDPSAQTVWVVSTGRIASPLLFAHTLVHFRSPPSLEQYCRDLGWITHTSGHSRSLMLVTSDDESLVKGTLDRLRPRAEDLVGLASVLVRQGANSTTVLLDSLCPAVGMNRARVEALIAIFARVGWVDHAQDWVRLRADCTDLVDRARGLGARLKTAKERDAQRLRSVSAYVISRGCRQESLRRHFGTAGSRPCGLCDACRTGRVVQSAPQVEKLAEETPLPPSTQSAVSTNEPPPVTPNTIFGERRPMRGRIIQIG